MKKATVLITIILATLAGFTSCKKYGKTDNVTNSDVPKGQPALDSIFVASFFSKHPKVKEYEPEVRALYRKHQYHFIWYDSKGINELADLLNSKINTLDEEGVETTIPYKKEMDAIFDVEASSKPDAETELFLSSLYFFYADKVFHGLDVKKRQELGWYLPRKRLSYVTYLDSLIANPNLINKDEKNLGQYYRLKAELLRYREIEKRNSWENISEDPKRKIIKVGDSSSTVTQVRSRLAALGHIKTDSGSSVYDNKMALGVLNYRKSVGLPDNTLISSKLLASLNLPLDHWIKTITVNMERCRWIPNDITKSKEYIAINIPSYQLHYFKDAKLALQSNVVVGKIMNQTVIFSGMMKFIVFSPYWNVPKSIIKKEIAPEMKKNKNYLEEHNMEWNGGQIRQKPGPENSLGLVKFLFPNSNNIYLHDSPAKSLFDQSSRAFSHGCIRVAKPAELANMILKDDKLWTPEKIDSVMHQTKESWYTLKHKIPVYIGYFTAWVDDAGVLHFYDDVYKRDDRLAELIFENK